jgi:hypothetical protein
MGHKQGMLTAAVLLVASGAVLAYKPATHGYIAEHASRRSVINSPDSDILGGLGLGTSIDDPAYKLPSSAIHGRPSRLTPVNLIRLGAINEDHGHRSLNHFFDPQQGGKAISVPFVQNYPSPDWALEDDFPTSGQLFSYKRAKEYLYKAITEESKNKRYRELGLLFEALGHVIHHIQDMHQPQHVRDEDHCDDENPLLSLFGTVVIGSICKVTQHFRPSAYEEYVAELGRALPLEGYPVPDYGTFATPRKFWNNGGMGSAEFTSSNFVSVRTNFTLDTSTRPLVIRSDPAHPYPRGDDATLTEYEINDPALIRRVTEPMPMAGDISFVETPVVDNYIPLFSAPNPKTSTLSIWYDSIVYNTGEIDAKAYPVFTLNSVNYQAALERLLPRAAAYSTGLINYFFRGNIEISPPARGVYGVVDHAQTTAGEGFTKIRMALRNTTPDGGGVPQEMPGGTLLAVAKYVRNACYQDDLSGEFAGAIDYFGGTITPSGCPIDVYLSGQEEISVSGPIVAANLARDAVTEIEFDFSHAPIPIDSRDVVLQVLYTGMLGEESDAVVVGAKNISEPTYLAVFNNSDYFQLDGQFYTPEEIRSDPALTSRVDFDRDGDVDGKDINIDPEPLLDVRIAIGEHYLTESTTLDPRNYLRIAVLSDAEDLIPVRIPNRFASTFGSNNTYNAVPLETQLSREPYILSALDNTRGVNFWFMLFVSKYYGPGNPPIDALKTLEPLSPDPGPTPITLTSP